MIVKILIFWWDLDPLAHYGYYIELVLDELDINYSRQNLFKKIGFTDIPPFNLE